MELNLLMESLIDGFDVQLTILYQSTYRAQTISLRKQKRRRRRKRHQTSPNRKYRPRQAPLVTRFINYTIIYTHTNITP